MEILRQKKCFRFGREKKQKLFSSTHGAFLCSTQREKNELCVLISITLRNKNKKFKISREFGRWLNVVRRSFRGWSTFRCAFLNPIGSFVYGGSKIICLLLPETFVIVVLLEKELESLMDLELAIAWVYTFAMQLILWLPFIWLKIVFVRYLEKTLELPIMLENN